MAYIPSHALAGLRSYKYKGVDRYDPSFILCERSLNIYLRSLLSNYVLNPFWNWFVTLWPEWVAPNMVRNQARSQYIRL